MEFFFWWGSKAVFARKILLFEYLLFGEEGATREDGILNRRYRRASKFFFSLLLSSKAFVSFSFCRKDILNFLPLLRTRTRIFPLVLQETSDKRLLKKKEENGNGRDNKF